MIEDKTPPQAYPEKSSTTQKVYPERKNFSTRGKIFTKGKEVEEENLSEKDLEKEAKKISLENEQRESEKIAKEKRWSPEKIEKKKKELLEKVKKLSGKVDVVKTAELKEQVKLKKRADMLVPLEDYIKNGIYLGTKVVTPHMKPFVYRRRADGLAIFNTDLIDEKLKEGVEYLSKFAKEDVILVCKRQAGWKAAKMFSKYTGIRVFTKKYPAGILTNTTLPDFFENELTIVCDSWLDRNALHDTVIIHKKVLMVCDTNNFSTGADQIVIGNNKSEKSLGVIFYLLARGYCKARKIEADIPDLEVWTGEE
ncbi:30S ribosomal protein S2 [Candidatus Pacearchaeota archaeon]|nr:30S ribosomal protein S2 [Candidatus Pacearchaeota archaeon]